MAYIATWSSTKPRETSVRLLMMGNILRIPRMISPQGWCWTAPSSTMACHVPCDTLWPVSLLYCLNPLNALLSLCKLILLSVFACDLVLLWLAAAGATVGLAECWSSNFHTKPAFHFKRGTSFSSSAITFSSSSTASRIAFRRPITMKRLVSVNKDSAPPCSQSTFDSDVP